LAQLISKQAETIPETRRRSMEIVNEADRVAAQLNEFINYSRPREVRRTTVQLNTIANEVMRALTYDIEEKKISLQLTGDAPSIEADEQLLRQALFNLLLNAVQAVGENGQITVRTSRISSQEATIEIADDGPGVAAAERTEIFKPYFTTTQKGAGLGLAIVKQICLVHGWEIRCVANSPRGARFIVSEMAISER
jgi:signal transduction histidine kinase